MRSQTETYKLNSETLHRRLKVLYPYTVVVPPVLNKSFFPVCKRITRNYQINRNYSHYNMPYSEIYENETSEVPFAIWYPDGGDRVFMFVDIEDAAMFKLQLG